MKIQNTHIVPNNIGEIRLCDYARNIFAEYIPSRNGIKKAIKKKIINLVKIS
jgi:hypothetical protein